MLQLYSCQLTWGEPNLQPASGDFKVTQSFWLKKQTPMGLAKIATVADKSVFQRLC